MSLTPSAKEIGVAAGEGRQQHVVDRAPVSVADLFGDLKAAADDGQTAVRPYPPVQAGPRSASLHEHLADRRPSPPGCAGRSRSAGLVPTGQRLNSRSRRRTLSRKITPSEGLGAGTQGGASIVGVSGAGSTKAPSVAIPATPSATTWVQLHEEADVPCPRDRAGTTSPTRVGRGPGGVAGASRTSGAVRRFVTGEGGPGRS